jgi:hypothetical protein
MPLILKSPSSSPISQPNSKRLVQDIIILSDDENTTPGSMRQNTNILSKKSTEKRRGKAKASHSLLVADVLEISSEDEGPSVARKWSAKSPRRSASTILNLNMQVQKLQNVRPFCIVSCKSTPDAHL